jgi:hypothetical protein
VREKKRYEARWRTEWWGDTRARNDAASALSIISKIGGGSLVAAARVYEQCRRAQEFRVADERTGGQRLELSARIRFGLEKAARRRGVSTEDLIAGVLWEFIEKESQACGEEEN